MVCDPSQNTLNIVAGPSPFLPGLEIPFSVPKLPFPDVNLPYGPEDLFDLLDRLFALLPANIKIVPDINEFTKSIWDAIASILNKLTPFLAFYKFIQALLNIILCVIDVLCALNNPWATVKAIKRLFKKCLPDFLSLFPWLALLLMILSLILLLIALIEYIIQRIIDYIKQLIENIMVLRRAIWATDEDSIIECVNKFSDLLCLFEQLLSILVAVAAIFAIIRPLMEIGGRGVCAKGGGGTDTDSSDFAMGICCTEDFCPDFISNYPDGPTSFTGKFIYQNQIDTFIPADPMYDFLRNTSLTPIRPERYQFVDDSPEDFKFLDIITKTPGGFIFWPEGESYSSDANTIRVPYLLDMNINLDPSLFGNPSDIDGYRNFLVKDLVVKVKPTTYPYKWNNQLDTSIRSGSIVIGGGTVWEYNDDGYSQYFIDGEAATLESLIHKNVVYGTIPSSDDSVYFEDVSYHFRYNHEVLVDKKLTTIMCQPDLSSESAVLNAEFGDLRSILLKTGELPNIGSLNNDKTDGTGTLGELARALTEFRSDINEDTINTFQEAVLGSLNSLLTDCNNFYTNGAVAASDRFTSDVSLSTNLQFINQDIIVTVTLKDKTGSQIALGVSQELGNTIAQSIRATTSFGDIGEFVYDGYGEFKAVINSENAGSGVLVTYINEESISRVTNRDKLENSAIVEKELEYEFVDATTVTETYADGYGPMIVGDDGYNYVPVGTDEDGNTIYGKVIDNNIEITDNDGNIIRIPITSFTTVESDTYNKIRFNNSDISKDKV